MRVFVMCEPGAWWDRTLSIIEQAGWDVTSGSTVEAIGDDVNVALFHIVTNDPLPLIAPLWQQRDDLPVVMLGDDIANDVRLAAVKAGVSFVGRANPSLEELVDTVRMACDESRIGSPELVRAFCRTVCSLSSVVATADSPECFAVAVREMASLFGESTVSIMLREPGDDPVVMILSSLPSPGGVGFTAGAGVDVESGGGAGALCIVASSGPFDPHLKAPADGVAWLVVREGVPRIIPRGTDVTSSMCVPIPGRPGELPRGVINVTRATAAAVFVPRDLGVCGSIAGLLAHALDAVEARTIARELRERMVVVEHLSTIGELAAGIAHEIANPLTSVRLNMHTIIETMAALAPTLGTLDGDPNIKKRLDELPELLAETWEGLEHAGEVIRQIRSLVQLNQETFTRDDQVSLGVVVSNTVRLMRARLGVDLRVHANDHIFVRGSAVGLSQAIVNLVVNAVDACVERAAREPGHRTAIAVSARQEGGHGLIEVEDNGSGIPPELLHRIFAPLFTTKSAERGTGLGLAIVRRVVDQHHGSVAVTSMVGAGTMFRIRVPLATTLDAGGA